MCYHLSLSVPLKHASLSPLAPPSTSVPPLDALG